MNLKQITTSKQKRRNKINKRWSIVDIEPKDYTDQLPTIINPEDFTAARISEFYRLLSLHKITKIGKNKDQNLPRHLRRRTNSYNLKLIPKKFREGLKNKTNKRKCKNKRRKFGRVCKYSLLQTHVWLAKRMHIKNLWNYKIPIEPTLKSSRFIQKAFYNECTVFDSSFVSCIEISSISKDNITKILFKFIHVDKEIPLFKIIDNQIYLNECKYGNSLFYYPDKYPPSLICPFEFSWFMNTNKIYKFWMWIHPSVFNTVLKLLENSIEENTVKLRSLKGMIARYELRGKNSFNVMRKALKLSKCDKNDLVLKNVMTENNRESKFNNIMLSLNIDIYKSNDIVKNFDKVLCNYNMNHELKEYSIKDLIKEIKDNNMKYSFVDSIDNNICNNNKWNIMIIKKDNGFDLLVPTVISFPVWISLIYCGGRAIGLKNVYELNLIINKPSFPVDYIDTLAGTMFNEWVKEINHISLLKKPMSKRNIPIKNKPFSCLHFEFSEKEIKVLRNEDKIKEIRKLINNHSYKLNFELGNREYISLKFTLLKGNPKFKSFVRVPSKVNINSYNINRSIKIFCKDDNQKIIGQINRSLFSLNSSKIIMFGLVRGSLLINHLITLEKNYKPFLLVCSEKCQNCYVAWFEIVNNY